MSSFPRRWQRKTSRSRKVLDKGEAPPRQHREEVGGGYSYLHETKGWRRVSPKRLGIFR